MVRPANSPELTRNYGANRNFYHRVFLRYGTYITDHYVGLCIFENVCMDRNTACFIRRRKTSNLVGGHWP